MKKIEFLLLILILAFSSMPAQKRFHKEGRDFKINKLLELEKIKLIETLNLDEETSARFISRRADHMRQQMYLINEKDSLLQELADIIKTGNANDELYNKKYNSLLEMENRIMKERNKFFTSLTDILTPEQRAKLMVFEFLFRNKVHEEIMKRRR